jgi:Tfp pilus assembly protein PilV
VRQTRASHVFSPGGPAGRFGLLESLARAVRRRLPFGDERGSFLIEVMVGAIVLAITTTAVLSGLDGAQDTGHSNKNRTEYSTLAQQDIERLRSLPIPALAGLDETRTVTVANVDYTVHSETEWVMDESGTTSDISCTDYNPYAEYLKVSATVTSPAGEDHPVKETTLLTPAPGAFGNNTGTATVLLTNRDGDPLQGISVSLSGPGSYTEATNSKGCAIFRYIPSGAYSAQVSGKAGWSNEVPATAPVTVNTGRTSLTPIEVEDPASLRAHFETPTGISTAWSRMTLSHAKLPAGFKVYPNDTATAEFSSLDATEVFPHNDAYGVYAGSCEANNPAVWDADYFQPGVNGYIELDPGDNLKSVDVTMPTLTISFTKLASRPRFHVTATQLDGPDCVEILGNTFYPSATGTTLETTRNFTMSLPFGRYQICIDDGVRRRTSTGYPSPASADPSTSSPSHHNLTPSTGIPLQQSDAVSLTTTSSGTAGTCPTP